MTSAYWVGVVGAILTAASIVAYQSTTDGARAKLHRWLQFWGFRIIQIWLFFQGGYVIVRFFCADGSPSREEIGFLLLSIFNCLAWGFFIMRNTIDFLKRRHQQ